MEITGLQDNCVKPKNHQKTNQTQKQKTPPCPAPNQFSLWK